MKIAPEAAGKVLTFLAAIGEWVEPARFEPPQKGIEDPSDLPFAQTAIAAGVWALVTGNQRHFTFLADYGIRVLTPFDFLRQWPGLEK